MKRPRLLPAALAGLALMWALPSPAFAASDCTCRYKGQDIAEGQVICAQLPTGRKLMRCGRVLNNTAWETIADDCPEARANDMTPRAQES